MQTYSFVAKTTIITVSRNRGIPPLNTENNIINPIIVPVTSLINEFLPVSTLPKAPSFVFYTVITSFSLSETNVSIIFVYLSVTF